MDEAADHEHISASPYDGEDRRRQQPMPLTDEQIERIAQRAAAKAVEMMTRDVYASIGKGVVKKAVYVIGVIALATVIFFKAGGSVTIGLGKP